MEDPTSKEKEAKIERDKKKKMKNMRKLNRIQKMKDGKDNIRKPFLEQPKFASFYFCFISFTNYKIISKSGIVKHQR